MLVCILFLIVISISLFINPFDNEKDMKIIILNTSGEKLEISILFMSNENILVENHYQLENNESCLRHFKIKSPYDITKIIIEAIDYARWIELDVNTKINTYATYYFNDGEICDLIVVINNGITISKIPESKHIKLTFK